MDFVFKPEWINAISSAISAGAVSFGLVFAYKQVSLWRTEARDRRRAEVAEDLMAEAQNAVDVIQSLRSPMARVPKENAADPGYTYKQRWERMAERNEVFQRLRHAQVRAKVVLQSDDVEDKVEDIFGLRVELLVALEMLFEMSSYEDLTPEEVEQRITLRRKAFSHGKKDDFGKKLDDTLTSIETTLGPVARLERKR